MTTSLPPGSVQPGPLQPGTLPSDRLYEYYRELDRRRAAAIGETDAAAAADAAADDKRFALSQWRLMARKFMVNRAALVGGVVVVLFYVSALFANFLAPYTLSTRFRDRIYLPPQAIQFFDEGKFAPFVYGVEVTIDPVSFRKTYTNDETVKYPIIFFAVGEPYRLFGLFPAERHLFLAEGGVVNLLGTDRQGRDMFTRILLGSQISLTIGLVGVFLSLTIGTILGVISGFYGGGVDDVIQRTIELVRSFPSIPLWMALSAAVPVTWPPLQVYFGVTLILSLIGWTWLARQLRGKILSLRHEDYILAAKLLGANDNRVIFKHLIPASLGHIIVVSTLAMPAMILAETALSFLGLGLQPPITSWGVLLQEVQDIQSIALYPWVFTPVIAIVLAILAFNFLGDGLRDASTPIPADQASTEPEQTFARMASSMPQSQDSMFRPPASQAQVERTPDAGSKDEYLLEINDLCTYFYTMDGVVRAVDGVSLGLRPGETLGVVGESGCGKSVTASSILRLLPKRSSRITNGEILFRRRDGQLVDMTTLNPDGAVIRSIHGNEISMIFQEPLTSFSPVYTTGSQIAEAVALHQQVSKQEARIRTIELLNQVGIPNASQRFDEYPHQFSGGMRQRAMIAMALSCQPRLLIADEPTTALDVTIQAQILELMKQLQADLGMAILIITHDLGVIAEMADNVVVMYLGKIVESGDLRTIFKRPMHPYTVGLLRSIPQLGSRAKERLTPIPGSVPDPFAVISGCAFYDRCPAPKNQGCRSPVELREVEPGHFVRCTLY